MLSDFVIDFNTLILQRFSSLNMAVTEVKLQLSILSNKVRQNDT